MMNRPIIFFRHLMLTVLTLLSSIFVNIHAEQPANPSPQADSPLARVTFAPAVKATAPATVTIVCLRPLSEEKQEQWNKFAEAQRRALTAVHEVIKVGGKWLEPISHGSGFIVDAKGHVVTNNHVVSGLDSDRGTTLAVCIGTESTWQPATLVGRDPATDLAVVRTSIGAHKPAVWGDSDAMQQGDFVLAIGTPRDLALKQTVTAGVVSATGRETGGLRYEDFIQTDASINPGNSGGPLINLKGEVVGVNQSIILGRVTTSDGGAAQSGSGGPLRADGNIGIGMAIPSKLARKVAGELIEHQRVRRGYLGVKVEENPSESGDQFSASIRVADVLPGSPAEKAGILEGDELLTFNERPVTSIRTFHLQVSLAEPGSKAAISLLRKGKPLNVEPMIADLSTTRYAAIGFDPTTQEFPEVEGLELKLASSPAGEFVVVSRVAPGSPSAKAGLKAPSLIVAVAGVEISSPDEFKAAVNTTVQDGHLLLTIREIRQRGLGKPVDVSVPVKTKK